MAGALAIVFAGAAMLAPTQSTPPTTVVVEVRGPLHAASQARLARAVREARNEKGSALILVIDTPGGEVSLMGAMGDNVDRASSEGGVETIAFVANGAEGGAISAGSFLALACDRIYMARGTTIGSALPVAETPFGIASPDEGVEGKIIAAFAARFRSLAEKRGRDPRIAAAFVDPTLGIYQVKLPDGSRALRSSAELSEMRARGEVYETVRAIQPEGSGRPLALTAQEAFDLGLVNGIVDGLEDLRSVIGREKDRVVRIEPAAGESFVELLVSATPVLLLLGALLGFIEAKIPGFGVAGVLSGLCFALVFFGQYLLGVAEWLEILLFALGLALLAVELFVVPGTLYCGTIGGLCLVVALWLSFAGFLVPRDAIDVMVVTKNLAWGAGSLLLAVILLLAISRYLPHAPLVSRAVLAPPSSLDGSATRAQLERGLVGRVVDAATDLRPAGVIVVEGVRIDVVTEGPFIACGTPVRVLEVEGNRVVVVAERRDA